MTVKMTDLTRLLSQDPFSVLLNDKTEILQVLTC